MASVFLVKKLRIYTGISDILNEFRPDIIFLHDCQFLSILTIVKYAQIHPVKIYVDSHTDFINSGKNWISKNILHKFVYRYCATVIEPFTTKFYGTLPIRNEFLRDIYHVPLSKIELLPFGADDSLFNWEDKDLLRIEFRKILGLKETDFVLITGGKIDRRKNIDILLKAFNSMPEKFDSRNIKLIVFGKPTEEMHNIFFNLIQNKNIIYLNWIKSENIFKYFIAADLAVFPGTHSVLWEEAVGLGLPTILHKWHGIQHMNKFNNCYFIDEATELNIQLAIHTIHSDIGLYKNLKMSALLASQYFRYSEIAKRSIEQSI